MPSSIAEFARSVEESVVTQDGFEATESITAGPIEVTARVRCRRPDMRTVEFRSYRSPLSELEERLMNGAEFTEDELTGMSFSYDGRGTWISEPKTATFIRKPSRALLEPLPGFSALGEVGFLGSLTHDFFIRDAGEEMVGGTSARLIGLKPKAPYRSQLLRATSFPIRRAVIALDEETLFPIRIEFFPARTTVLSSLVGERNPVVVTYKDVRLEAPDASAFSLTPPEDARVFHETFAPIAELADSAPFPCNVEPLLQQGYRAVDGGGTITVDAAHGRGYCVVVLAAREDEQEPRLLTVRAGNYLSRNMSRRRATLAQHGEAAQIGPIEGQILDRGSRWAQEMPQETDRNLFETTWTEDETFWFLSGDGLEREKLLELSSGLAAHDGEAPDPLSQH
ncbi:hypothetical protein ACFLTM_01890 [Candidatus Bipolaricaulota bacterium]